MTNKAGYSNKNAANKSKLKPKYFFQFTLLSNISTSCFYAYIFLLFNLIYKISHKIDYTEINKYISDI